MAEFTGLSYFPDWAFPVVMRYRCQTSIHLAQTTKEQRSSLRGMPQREASYNFSGQTADEITLVNKLTSLLKTKIIVPIFTEELSLLSYTLQGIQGGGAVDTLLCDDVANMFNLSVVNMVDNLVDSHIVVADFTGEFPWTMYRVHSISGNNITLNEELDYLYNVDNVKIYPAFVGQIKSFEKVFDTDSESTINAVFTELESWFDYTYFGG